MQGIFIGSWVIEGTFVLLCLVSEAKQKYDQGIKIFIKFLQGKLDSWFIIEHLLPHPNLDYFITQAIGYPYNQF